MQDATPDVVTLRTSRIGVLKRIIVFALQLLSGLRSGKPSIARFRKKNRLLHWIAVASYLIRRIGDGALDAPRAANPDRRARAKVEARERLVDWEREDDDFCLAVRNPEAFERYLDMPFAAAVERICKGVGLKPDWQAWATEPWARAEIRARPPSTPNPRPAASPATKADQPSPAAPPQRSEPNAPLVEPPGPLPDAEQPPPLNRQARRAVAARARKPARLAVAGLHDARAA